MRPSESNSPVVSIDPVIAKEILATTKENVFRESSSSEEIDKSDRKSKEKGTVTERAPSRQKEQQGKPQKRSKGPVRNNSLRHVKNSTEVLKQRAAATATMKPMEPVTENTPAGRGGRQFTVGNVGNNGRLYLRPMAHPDVSKPRATALLAPDLAHDDGVHDTRDSFWSTSQLSGAERKPPTPPSSFPRGKFPPEPKGHHRSYSYSTVDDQKSSASKDKTFKIVIDRTGSSQANQAEPGMPTLEVPIPNYRLGTPRFSTYGSPILRSSVYTRTTISDNNRASSLMRPDFDRLFPSPPGPSSGLAERWANSSFLLPGDRSSDSCSGVTRSSAALPSPGMYSVKVPIEPEVFDTLATCMDNASVVRFSPKTGEITAATPARIIAQISSESFMDYELVSDFFLTFRSYLSCENVLNLLLARLKWAINRQQEDGRIIRIRTFAALRHWILNYFQDDFVVNRALRVQFCKQINEMYHQVKAREGGGTSDLKIILDLKRCWNGRCAMVWDPEDFVLDGQQEADIVPGGPEENQFNFLDTTKPKQAFDRNSGIALALQDSGVVASGAWIDMSEDRETAQHVRQFSEVSVPLSRTSEYSVQPMSCSIPSRSFKRTPPPPGEHAKGPRPVPLPNIKRRSMSMTQKRSPQRGHAHKRSGSFTDSVRDDRASLEETNIVTLELSPANGSLIRGRQFPPGDAIVNAIAPMSPTTPMHQFDLINHEVEHGQDSTLRPGGPPMKHLMGSIRRALSTRQPPGSPIRNPNPGQVEPPSRGKTATLPVNVAYSNDHLRERKSSPNLRRPARIDLLCAEIHQSYQAAVTQTVAAPLPSPLIEEIGIASSGITEEPTAMDDQPKESLSPENLQIRHGHLPSDITTGSRSIVIVDDTGHTMPTMSGALLLDSSTNFDPNDSAVIEDSHDESTQTLQGLEPESSKHSSGVLGHRRSLSLPSYRDSYLDFSEVTPQRVSSGFGRGKLFTVRRSSSVGNSKRYDSMHSASTTLRRYASYQSSVSRPRPDPSLDNTATTVSGSSEHPTPRMLRRRPGGDLRKFQNVHDLEPGERPQSMLSLDADTDSNPPSLMYMTSNLRADSLLPEAIIPGKPQNKPVSLMKTDSTVRMRPSFEAVVKNFAQIPDDDDGGLEATLMKLEGRYERRSPISETMDTSPAIVTSPPPDAHTFEAAQQLPMDHRSDSTIEPHQNSDFNLKPQSSSQSGLRASLARRISPIFGLATVSVTGSDESYSSIPLLERGLRDSSMQRPRTMVSYDVEVPRPLFSRHNTEDEAHKSETSHPSIEVVSETESMKRIPPGSVMPDKRVSHNESFLLDNDDHLSDLSSELSVDVVEYPDPNSRTVSPLLAAPGTAISGVEIPSHPLAHPPTPPFNTMTFQPLVVNTFTPHQMPLTPDPSPTFDQHQTEFKAMPEPEPPKPTIQVAHNIGHIAFILAYDSEILAQQFTLVEKAALSEVDWTDLVDMKWDTKSPDVLNWVEYLQQKEHKGIDLVTSRFNLMVKWVLSEVVMTQDMHERARTIVKFIHVAAHARKIRNYATMLQIVIGLTSTDCTRLTKTWELVNSTEKKILKEMELLVQPVRNFHALREEMECTDLQEGCIPFVGLYIHDLTYNAQKPAQIASTREGEPLINFERYRKAATIVKNLLRLIDLSSKYNFRPAEGIIQRCLWIAAFPDPKIRAFSQSLE